jgi:hypothetical protein
VAAEVDRTMYCRRCDDVVRVVAPWSGWKRVRNAWSVGAVAVVCASPIWFGDFCVLIPSAFGYLLAGTVLFRLANERPSCSVCSLVIRNDSAGTGVRARPAP